MKNYQTPKKSSKFQCQVYKLQRLNAQKKKPHIVCNRCIKGVLSPLGGAIFHSRGCKRRQDATGGNGIGEG